MRYAQSYAKQTSDSALVDRIDSLLRIFDSLTPEELTTQRALETVADVQRLFRDSWATVSLTNNNT